MILTKTIADVLPVIAIGVWVAGGSVLADDVLPESTVLTIDAATINRGAMIGSARGEVVIAVPPMALERATEMSLTFGELDTETIPDGWQLKDSWSVMVSWAALLTDEPQPLDRVSEPEASPKTAKPAPGGKPVMQLLMPIGDFEFVPFIARWDATRLKWIRLPTSIRWDQDEVITPLVSAGRYALFQDTTKHLIGRATWYPDRLSKDTRLAAASNEYPLRTRLKVSNIQTKESVIVTVQSVGPFVKGRIIDLTKTAFSKIGYPRKQGVIQVRVEPL